MVDNEMVFTANARSEDRQDHGAGGGGHTGVEGVRRDHLRFGD